MNEQIANESNEKPRILIVDNNSRFARGARLFLDRTGKYVACSVIDPRRALESARSFKPDLVLVDLIMPQEDGPKSPRNSKRTGRSTACQSCSSLRSSQLKRQRMVAAFMDTGFFRSRQAARS